MRRELFIVARDRSDLYRYLSRTFADAENVEVILDRRAEERRHLPSPTTPDRRRRDRRGNRSVEEDLRTVGYAFLVVD